MTRGQLLELELEAAMSKAFEEKAGHRDLTLFESSYKIIPIAKTSAERINTFGNYRYPMFNAQ